MFALHQQLESRAAAILGYTPSAVPSRQDPMSAIPAALKPAPPAPAAAVTAGRDDGPPVPSHVAFMRARQALERVAALQQVIQGGRVPDGRSTPGASSMSFDEDTAAAHGDYHHGHQGHGHRQGGHSSRHRRVEEEYDYDDYVDAEQLLKGWHGSGLQKH